MDPVLNIRGDRYGLDEPCYFATPQAMIYNRITKRWVTFASLNALATAMSYSWSAREISVPSMPWQNINDVGPGQDWAPWEDSSGFVSNSVTNGEDWTGATGATPPTGWTQGGDPAFSVAGGELTITNAAAGDDTLTQTQTTVAGTVYVLELKMAAGSTGNVTIMLDGVEHRYGGGAAHMAFSVTAADTDIDIGIKVSGPGAAVVDWMRFYAESEYVGVSAGTVVEPPNPIQGPFNAFGTTFWINTENCKVGLEADTDPEPDVWLTRRQVCKSDIEDRVKLAINVQLISLGCPALPCAGDLNADPE